LKTWKGNKGVKEEKAFSYLVAALREGKVGEI